VGKTRESYNIECQKGMYNPESGEQFSKHKRRLKSLGGTIENLLNKFYNKYSQDIICIDSVKSQALHEETDSCIFFYLPT
jgi:hypothetical protein